MSYSDHYQGEQTYISSPGPYSTNKQANATSQQTSTIPGSNFAQSRTHDYGYYPIESSINNHYGQNRPTTGVSGTSQIRSSSANKFVSSQVTNQDVVKGESRINYVPYEKKITVYEDRQYVERVPIKKKVTQYKEERVMETIPREVTKTDYYALQKRIEYHKEIIPEKKIEMVPVQKKVKRYEYVPVEKQIVHYPENVDLETAKGQSRIVLEGQGVHIRNDAQFRRIDPGLIYNVSNRPESKYQPIGYVDQGLHRVMSNVPDEAYHEYHLSTSQAGRHYPFQSLSKMSNTPQQPASSSYLDPSVRRQLEPSGSYVNELNNLNYTSTNDKKRPFQMIGSTDREGGYNYRSSQQEDYKGYGGTSYNSYEGTTGRHSYQTTQNYKSYQSSGNTGSGTTYQPYGDYDFNSTNWKTQK